MMRSFAAHRPLADAIAALWSPDAEVVIHDLATGRIAYIVNASAGRKKGDDSLLDLSDEELNSDSMLGPYEKAGRNGERIRSVSAILRSDAGRAIGLLCVNISLARFDHLGHALTALFPSLAADGGRPASLFRKDWREQVNLLISQATRKLGKPASALPPSMRATLVREMHERGLLEVRRAVEYVAELLGVSRATLYSDLASIRRARATRKG